MKYNEKMFNRQIGRNTQLFAQAVGALETPEARYPYLRILVSVIEQARPEWIQVPQKEQLFTHLIHEMTDSAIAAEEIAQVLAVRDAERQVLQDIATGKVKAPAPTPEAAQPEVPTAEAAPAETGEPEAVPQEASSSAETEG